MVVDILAVARRVRHQVVAAAVRIRSRLRETATAMDTVSAAVRHQIVRRIVHQKVKDISPRVATAAHLEEATITTVVTNPVAEAAAIVPEGRYRVAWHAANNGLFRYVSVCLRGQTP